MLNLAEVEKDSLFEQIRVDVETGVITYPKPEGFELDTEAVYRTAALFAPFCHSTEMAVRQAVHQQLIAYRGAASIRRVVGK